MPGNWIKWNKGLIDKPEVIRMAAALGVCREIVVCRLMRFWEWADDQIGIDMIDAHGTGAVQLSPSDQENAKTVDALVGTAGFAKALEAVGWAAFEAGFLRVPNFGRHNGATAKTRARNGRNQRVKREGPPAPAPPAPPQAAPKLPPSPPPGEREPNTSYLATESPRPSEKPPRRRNPVFDALTEVTGLDPATAGRLIGKVAANLEDANPPYTPEEVREFGQRFHELCPWAAKDGRERPTPTELQKHIGLIRAKPVKRAPVVSAEDRARRTAELRAKEEEDIRRARASPPPPLVAKILTGIGQAPPE